MKPIIQLKQPTLVFIVAVVLACLAIPRSTQAVVPAPDGGYPNNNTAEGTSALFSLTTGADNTAVGLAALGFNLGGSDNTAVGTAALIMNTASQNTALGSLALFNNTTGMRNTATGFSALFSNTPISVFTGNDNTAVGFEALASNTYGGDNTAIGSTALLNNMGGVQNTAVGEGALSSNTGAGANTAIGRRALFNLSGNSGTDNTAVGVNALLSETTGNHNIALGFNAGANLDGDNNIDIGNEGLAGENGTIRIGDVSVHGATFVAGISGQNASGGDAVFVTSTGKLGTVTAPSSARFKDEIKPMNKASEVLLALKPVTFRYKKKIDPNGIQQFGLVAEEVEKVAPDLVKRDRDGQLQTVRYDAVNAMLLNEFIKEHRKNEEQQSKVEQQGATIARLEKQIEALSAGVQKVTAQLELREFAPQVVENNQ